MEGSAPTRISWLSALSGVAGLIATLWLGFQVLTLRLQAPAPAPATGGTAALDPPPPLEPCHLGDREGFLAGRMFGSEALEIDWRGDALACAGNARPDGGGLRLFFAGNPAGAPERLVLVLGIGAGIDGLAGRESPVSVTLIDEASSQFFHSAADRCFTLVRDVAALGDGSYRLEGDLYCVGAIPAVSGAASVTLGDMKYAGRLTLGGGSP